MQEEVENKTVNLAVKTTKVSLKLLIRALIAYKRKLENKQRLKQVAKNTHTKGKQSVKELIGQDQGVSSMEKEAAEYSNIGINKLECLLRSPRCPFVLYVGKKKLVKRKEFEKFISDNVEI